MSAADDSNRSRFEAWLRGELDAAASERFLADASSDPELADEVAAHRELAARIGRLPAERSPERDLWPGIAARLAAARPARPRLWRVAALAAALLVAGGLALIERRGASPPPVRPPYAVVEAPPASPADGLEPAPVPAAYAATGAELDRLRGRLRREVERRSAELPAAARATVDENLETIDRAIAAIETELALRPDDRSLARTSIAYRQRQLELLRRVNQTAARL